MSEKLLEFVQGIAGDSPTIAGDSINYCKYCGQTWAEDTWHEYTVNAEILKADKEAKVSNGYGLVAWRHHDSDCMWVQANILIRELNNGIMV